MEAKTRDWVFDYVKQTNSSPVENKSFQFNLFLKPVAVSLLVLFFIAGTGLGTIALSKKSLPGSPLYPVKKLVEKSQLFLAFNYSKKAVLKAEILNNRFSEFKILADQLREGKNGKSSEELDLLAQNFAENLEALKKEVKSRIPEPSQDVETPGEVGLLAVDPEQGSEEEGEVTPFPEEDLLAEQPADNNGDLPVQDDREIFKVIPDQDMEKLLAETKELLAQENMALAFANLEKIEELASQELIDQENEEEKEGEGKENEEQDNINQEGQEIEEGVDPVEGEPAKEYQPVSPVEEPEEPPVENLNQEVETNPISGSLGEMSNNQEDNEEPEEESDFGINPKIEPLVETGGMTFKEKKE